MEFWDNLVERYQLDHNLNLQSIDSTNEILFFQDQEGVSFALKRFSALRAQKRELVALNEWGPRLDCLCPRVISSTEEPEPAILMTHLGGKTPTPSESNLIPTSRLAGASLRALHQLPIQDHDPMPIEEALRKRFEEVTSSAKSWLGGGLSEFVQRAADSTADLPTRKRVPCHGDYVGRNWRIDGDVPFAILDFENAKMNILETDFLKLHMESWTHDTASKHAFLESYGTTWSPAMASWVSVLEILYLVGTVNWGQAKKANETAADALTLLKSKRRDTR